jgi:hypothetical protein
MVWWKWILVILVVWFLGTCVVAVVYFTMCAIIKRLFNGD